MQELRIPLAAIPEEGLSVSVDFDPEELRPEEAEALPVTSGRIEGDLTRMGEQALFRGAIHAEMEQACDRCLEPLKRPLTQECTWFFESDAGEDPMLEEPDVRHLDGDTVDLGRYVWEEMALAMPARYVCDDDEPCAKRDEFEALRDAAPVEEPNNAFAQLKDMFPELDGDKEKE